ncbi:regulatory protein, Fis family [Paracoccus halophilus]|uniref:Fis family transcriptional regulator n=1 Tax=Paracoccus halophilus TaxID=376733 RepID=A0A099F3Q2_9RHOB|nr:GAF domain-containing protein [Paracoccus halophilus]KGJ05340.1 Fis family transcriptional regulator [Paracoccus halophilus]SFA48752.1 regulatory protein, Fis family [Paracoccus halophilus]
MPETRHVDRVVRASQSPAAVTRLAASWRRSMVKHGLDPARPEQLRRMTEQETALRIERMGDFLAVARPQIDQLFQLVCATGCNVLLTDADGIVLEQRVNEADAPVFRDWGLWQGVDWSEPAEGTNGIGTCLAEGRQVTIHRDEHFYARNTALSCIDAPIWGPDGRLLGALDVSSARADHTERWNGLIAAQVTQSARQIEAAFFRASFPGARIISAQIPGQAPGAEDALLLVAVDRDDIAIGANRAARRAYGLEKEGALRPRPASDLLGREDSATGFEKAERAAVIRALTRAEGNVSAAARALGIGRATLYRRMQRLGIDGNPGRLSQT